MVQCCTANKNREGVGHLEAADYKESVSLHFDHAAYFMP